MSEAPRIGILGGTFDPPHLGHLVVAQEVRHRLGLERVLLVPAAVPPHKRARSITPGPVRREMVAAAIAGRPGLEVCDLELKREGPSYTADTLRELAARHPGAALFLILGADQLAELDTWREPETVRSLATIVGIHREGEAAVGGAGAGGRGIVEVDVPRLDISSTEIRRRVGAGEPIELLVPDAVRSIIERDGLYDR